MHKKILIIGPSWVGDSIMAQPMYHRLHQHHTNLELHVLAPAWTLPLLKRMPEVAATHLSPFAHGMLALKKRWHVARALAAHQFDQAIILPNSLKSALIPCFSGIPLRTGFLGESRYGLLNDIRKLDERVLPMMVERFCALAEAKGTPPPKPIPYPRLTIDLAQQQLTLQRLQLNITRPIIVLCPGAEYGPAKRWPARHFAHIARLAVQEGYTIWLLGSAKDRPLAEEICALSHQATHNLCGVTNLEEAIDLISLSKLTISNDSGLMHVAAALNKPLVALYGSSSPGFTPPLGNQVKCMSLNLDCSPCFKRHCPYKHTDCLEKLLPNPVWDAAQTLLISSFTEGP